MALGITSIEIGAGLVNKMGFVLLAVVSLYMLFAYGAAIRQTASVGFGRTTSYVVGIVQNDVRTLIGGMVAVIVGALGWTLGLGNLGAAFAGLGSWVGSLWFWFTNGVLSVANSLGITDFGIVQVVFVASAAALIAAMLRSFMK